MLNAAACAGNVTLSLGVGSLPHAPPQVGYMAKPIRAALEGARGATLFLNEGVGDRIWRV